ncbi:MAG: oxidoreductase-like [Moraxellaceae bacterium]|jgi:predicted dehydrogenase|nr:oxidoreductase-like [Moraxellaceae bacterium]
MQQLLLIGAGQLGSRHLQALAQFQASDVAITVVDPSPAALALARERLAQVTASPQVRDIRYCLDLDEAAIPAVDFCVIATSANCRLSVLRDLLGRSAVRYLLLEKVLFQSVAQLDEASALLAAFPTRTWVNCPRRMFPGYQHLRELLSSEGGVSLHVAGNNWGMACNAIHFIDLWAFVGGGTDYVLDTSGLQAVLASKRQGYQEVTGRLAGRAGNSRFELAVCVDEAPARVRVHLESANYAIDVDEAAGECRITYKADGRVETIPFPVSYQSQLTHLVAQSVLAGEMPALATYAESSALHRPFLAGMLDFFRGHDDAALLVCPIT